MKIAFHLDDKLQTLSAPALELVRLVASVFDLGYVDVEPFPEKVEIRAKGINARGKTEEDAAMDFLRRALA